MIKNAKQKVLDEVCDKFMKSTGQSISFIDNCGEWLNSLEVESFTNFCRCVMQSEKGREACRQCNFRFLDKVKGGCVDVSQCHMGLTVVSVPIPCESGSDTILSFGQFILNGTQEDFYRVLRENSKRIGLDYEQLKKYAGELSVISDHGLSDRIEILKIFSTYVEISQNEQAVHDMLNEEMRKKASIEGMLSNAVFDTVRDKVSDTFIINTLDYIAGRAYENDDTEVGDLLHSLSYVLQLNSNSGNHEISADEEHNFIKEYNRLMALSCHDDSVESVQNKSGDNKLIEKALNIINTQYGSEISLQSVADKLFITPVYLSSLFKKEVGQTFSKYLMEVRMQKAMKLLKKGDIKISQVAQAVGIDDSSYFSRIFKKYYGFSPKDIN